MTSTLHSRLGAAALVLLATLGGQRQAAGQSRIVHDSVYIKALEGNLFGDSATREVLVYLPPTYDREPKRRFPVLYLLHGFTSLPSEWLDGSYPGLNLQMAMDSLLAGRAHDEFIVVMPDANSRLGGGFYSNSPVAGGWADFIVHDLVSYIDGHYRTQANRTHRALAGHSMGGYGTLVLGFQHPELFGLLYAMSPCCVTFEGELSPTSDAWAAAAAASSWQVPRTPLGIRFVVALAAALSPDPDRPRRYGELPYEPDSAGQLRPRPAALERWRSRMPIGLIPAYKRYRHRAPELFLEYGEGDQIPSVVTGVAALTHALDSAQVRYVLSSFAGGHIDRMPERIGGALLPTVARWFGSAH